MEDIFIEITEEKREWFEELVQNLWRWRELYESKKISDAGAIAENLDKIEKDIDAMCANGENFGVSLAQARSICAYVIAKKKRGAQVQELLKQGLK